jgi:DNA repair photolyase
MPLEVRYIECSVAAPPSKLPGLDRAINPYRGCAHACAYCYAQDVTRFEAGRPWGEVVEAKANIARRLKRELSRGTKGVYGIGTVTDPYQPLEEKLELTRSCLSLLRRFDARASILTKSELVLRDIDLMVGWPGLEVGMSIACADDAVAGIVEPNASQPSKRFKALAKLADEGVDVYLMAAPVIPGLSDSQQLLERLVEAAHGSGVKRVMWDLWNPKAMAAIRLRTALEGAGRSMPRAGAAAASNTSSILRRACEDKGIQLVSAF